ncbi:hypothetical protein [Nocardia aurantiaca]|uniref:Uncharacterized protein n=1 Tax=Nocardia aurantiaca TaxID=2675850 RepID=A0A6I3L4F4_9NOCA|nr:hypothetical protein [Nocardia aurantiaca]MTE16727.1 hypothetical protein [Nocardia aurantiaca]
MTDGKELRASGLDYVSIASATDGPLASQDSCPGSDTGHESWVCGALGGEHTRFESTG